MSAEKLTAFDELDRMMPLIRAGTLPIAELNRLYDACAAQSEAAIAAREVAT